MKVSQGKHPGEIVLSNGHFEYEVSDQMKALWDSLSERERETALNISLKQNRDLRDVLADQM